jgi:hypothetical protein
VVAPVATAWTTTHQFVLSGTDWALSRRESSLGRAAIHGELLKLGIVVSERTVSRYFRERPRKPSQTWRTFLRNHLDQFTDMSQVPPSDTAPDDVVVVGATTDHSSLLFDPPPALIPCAEIDWSAWVHTSSVGARFAVDHRRNRRRREKASRAPPKTVCEQATRGAHAEGGCVALARTTATIHRVRLLRFPIASISKHETSSFALRSGHQPM